jgi:RimJ/RimL family protein N-acetyltransferase
VNGVTLSDGVLDLSPLKSEDAEAWLAGQDEEEIRWFEMAGPSQLSDAQRFIAERIESWRDLGAGRHWGIRFVGSPVLMGGVEVRQLADSEVNLAYVVFPPYRHRGLARRASLLALRYAAEEMGARTAVIRTLPGNEYSLKLAASLGGVYSGEEPSYAGAVFKVLRVDLAGVRNEAD